MIYRPSDNQNNIKWLCKPYHHLSLDEWHDIIALRIAVFVIEQQCLYQDLDGKDPKSYHLMAWSEDNNLLAYSRLIPLGVSYKNAISIGRIITTPAARGKGLGHQLMEESIKYLHLYYGNDAPICISAQDHLEKFYAHWGFQKVSDPYDEDGIPHIKMLRSPS